MRTSDPFWSLPSNADHFQLAVGMHSGPDNNGWRHACQVITLPLPSIGDYRIDSAAATCLSRTHPLHCHDILLAPL